MFNISMHRRDYYRYSHKSSVRQQKHQHKLKFDNIISRSHIKRKDHNVNSGGDLKRMKYDFDDYEEPDSNVMCKVMFLAYMLLWGVPIYYVALFTQ